MRNYIKEKLESLPDQKLHSRDSVIDMLLDLMMVAEMEEAIAEVEEDLAPE